MISNYPNIENNEHTININMNLPKLANISKNPEHIAQQKQQLFSSAILIKASLLPKSTQSFSCLSN